jgi:two-component system sensor kinase
MANRKLSVAIAITLGVFVLDVLTPVEYSEWVLYIIPTVIAASSLRRSYIFYVPSICTLLVVLGYFLSPPGGDPQRAIVNRSMGVGVLWTVSYLLLGRKKAQETLEQLYNEVENRVDDRTKELSEANESLHAQITERKRTVEALRRTSWLITKILESITDAFFALDENLVVTYFNSAAARLLNRNAEDVVGRQLFEAFPEARGSIFEENYIRAIREKVTLAFEVYFPVKPYENWYDVRVYPQENGISVYFQVTTERKKAEDEIRKLNEVLQRRAQELELAYKNMESFSYSVSHDLRAPLRMISSMSDIVLKDCYDKLDDAGRKLLKSIQGNAKRMDKLVLAILDLAKAGRREMKIAEIDMEKEARLIADELKAMPLNVNLNIKQIPPAHGDITLIHQVLTNLLSNAVKFTKGRDVASIEVGGWSEESENIYYVKDNGAGFDMNHANKLFGVFHRLHSAKEFEGIGIGLSIVQRIIQRHGGRVWAEGKPDEGATFYFTLPIKEHCPMCKIINY